MKSRFYRHVMQLGWSLVRFSQRRCGRPISTEEEHTFKVPVKAEYIGSGTSSIIGSAEPSGVHVTGTSSTWRIWPVSRPQKPGGSTGHPT